MFYLLRNKIISDTEHSLNFSEFNNNKYLTIDGYEHEHFQIFDSSENLYDLIKVGDLIKYDNTILEILYLVVEDEIVVMETSKGIHLPLASRFLELTTAIYKPEELTGNYIQVWKKK